MNDYTLTAAAARLRADANKYPWLSQSHDIIAILAALEAAQADAARGHALADELADNYYCERCDRAPAKSVQLALEAMEATMKGEGDGATAAPSEATASVTDPAADPLPVAWATPSLLVTMSAVEKRRLTSPEMRGRGGGWEADARDADRYSVPLYRAAALDRLRAERDELREWKVGDDLREAEFRALRAERDTLAAIVRAIARDPHGCPFCDSGKLRQPYDPSKGHDANCGYLLMDAARARRGDKA